MQISTRGRARFGWTATACAFAIALALSLIPGRSAHAAIRPEDREKLGRPVLVAPAQGERLVESAARFAFEMPSGATQPMLVIGTSAFDPRGWTEIPGDAGLTVREATKPVLSLADLGLKLDTEHELWWALAVRDGGTGRLRVSEVRSFKAQPRFHNTVMRSPFLSAARTGRLDASQLLSPASEGGAATMGAPRIRLSAGYDFVPSDGAPMVPAELASASKSQNEIESDGLETYLVQFPGAPGPDQVAAITSAGGAVFSYIPDQAYVVRMSPRSRARLESQGATAWVGDFQPAYKLSPLVDRSRSGSRAYMVLAFPDADLGALSSSLAARGLAVTGQWDNGINKLIRVEATGADLPAVAGLSGVAWVEPVLENKLDNSSAQWVVQTNQNSNRRVWDMGIQGQGQVVTTSDSGINTNHRQFIDSTLAITNFGDFPGHRKVIAYKVGGSNPAITFGDHAGASYHGTHTACTLMGNDSINVSTDLRDGMAKLAKIYFMDISGTTLANSVDPFADLNDLFLPPYLGNGGGAARISSNSWGSAAAGVYTLNAYQCDQFMWTHPDFMINFSTGNSGPGGTTVGSPASAKNVGGVGGTANAGSTLIYSPTSRGPTVDGRRKPTYCSPGQSVSSANGSGTAFYQTLSGTSMASPTTSGAMTLMRQYLTDGWYPTGAPVPANGFSPSAALLKAMAINAAANVVTGGFNAPDNNVGWGKINCDSVLFFAGDVRKLMLVDQTNGLTPGQFIEYQVNVTDGSIPLEVSLCWTDAPGNPAAAVQIVNNLNLVVSNGATTYKGNVYTGGLSTTGGSADVVNVEEGVRVGAPATGIWTVRVESPSVPLGPQPFGLVITGGVSNGAGLLALDRAEYGSTSTVQIRVTDTNAGASVSVGIASTTEGTPETVTLPGANGIYTGSINLTPLTTPNGDGTLSVSNGDALTATYVDASPAATLVASATVNFDTPLISNVQASPAPLGSNITWTTDRASTSKVYYGVTPALELGSATSAGVSLNHSVVLSGLSVGTTYYYDVESVSLSGSLARDDLGGAHYKFTVKGAGDILIVYGIPGFERTVTWNSMLTANAFDYDVWDGLLANTALLGDVTKGLRSYKAVLWQVGFDEYPGFSDAQRDSITAYLDGGGRLAVVGHDIGWGLADSVGGSPSFTTARAAWLQYTLKSRFLEDPTTWSRDSGRVADPISGNYVSPAVLYTPVRAGGAGDEIQISAFAGGSASYVWKDNDATTAADNIALRWESGVPNGSPATAYWGGLPSRLVAMFFEITAMDNAFTSPSAIRNDILDKTVTWLLGRVRPTVVITSPNGAEILSSTPVNITWNETVGAPQTIVNRVIEYSLDGGSSWNALATGVGPSPYSWDLSAVPNAAVAKVRIRITDDGTPALGASDASDANFSISRTGGDVQGPLVLAGSIECAPNPIINTNPATISARVSDLNTGGGTVAAAEWSFGPSPAAAGSGTPLSGAFGATTVDVSGALTTGTFPTGVRKLWVRAQDASSNWGPASSLTLQVNGDPTVGTEDGAAPTIVFLRQNAPNPFGNSTLIRFGVPARGRVDLGVFDLQGRLVRNLVHGDREAGVHSTAWDRRNDQGARVNAGVYYYRLVTREGRTERRMVVLD